MPRTTPHALYNFVQRHVAHIHTPYLIPKRTLEKALLFLVSSPLYLLSASCVTWGEQGHKQSERERETDGRKKATKNGLRNLNGLILLALSPRFPASPQL